MFLKYTPDDADPQTFEFYLGKLRTMEAEAIEKHTGLNYGSDYKQALLMGNVRARRALLWTLLRRQHPTLKYADVDFADDELVIEYDTDEWADIRAAVEKATHLDEEARAVQLAAIDAAIAEAPPAGKARSKPDESGTGSPSPS
jgi:hypothetical protein